jgi:hypothetical protein
MDLNHLATTHGWIAIPDDHLHPDGTRCVSFVPVTHPEGDGPLIEAWITADGNPTYVHAVTDTLEVHRHDPIDCTEAGFAAAFTYNAYDVITYVASTHGWDTMLNDQLVGGTGVIVRRGSATVAFIFNDDDELVSATVPFEGITYTELALVIVHLSTEPTPIPYHINN